MDQLIAYLRDNLILDFQGDLTLEAVREFLKSDNSPEARTLLAKMVEDRGSNEMLIVLADCLLDTVQKSLSDEVMRNNLRIYAES